MCLKVVKSVHLVYMNHFIDTNRSILLVRFDREWNQSSSSNDFGAILVSSTVRILIFVRPSHSESQPGSQRVSTSVEAFVALRNGTEVILLIVLSVFSRARPWPRTPNASETSVKPAETGGQKLKFTRYFFFPLSSFFLFLPF